MLPTKRWTAGGVVHFSTLLWGKAALVILLTLAVRQSVAAEAAAEKRPTATSTASKGGHNRKPYPPLRTAVGQPAASSSVARGTGPPLRDAAAGATPPLIIDGKSYLMIGQGDLTVANQPNYHVGLYLEHVGARAQFGSLLTRAPTRAMLMSESRAQYFVIWGRFAKLLQLKLTKPATKAELAEMFHSSMPEVFADRAPVELRKDGEALLKLLDQDLAEGQELRLHIGELGQIDLYLDGQKHAGPQSAKLARHLIEIWLGYRSAARTLRGVLVDKIEVLKTPLIKPSK
jgi:hypothetical protein